MFLSGQIFDNAAVDELANDSPSLEALDNQITYHGKPIEVKDRLNRFTVTDENIWNNPYRATSYKIRNFFHSKDQEFKCTFIFDLFQLFNLYYISRNASDRL